MDYDVAIIGGGPGGSTTGTLLKKYNPDYKVIILEREKFPRDHVGESQLPPISLVLEEMGCWDKVEAADFPIKIGATYRWGKTPELCDFAFVPREEFKNEQRPAKFVGQRTWTAFQVDRAIYDKILLDHAAEMGCEVREETKVNKVLADGDRVDGLELATGEVIKARYYMDCSGHSGILRRAMGVETDSQTSLQNIAIWDYWQNAKWAEEIGVGGTFIQIMALKYGWIWFIPLGPTRTSIGFVTSADYYKKSGMKPEDIYAKALAGEERVAGLIQGAESENKLTTTKDWSFVAKRHFGENWFLVGESAGFADPILSAGLTMAHWAGREVAYTVLELDRGDHDAQWLKAEYETRQARRVENHIRFADYWYTANEQFVDLKDFTAQIAKDNGFDLDPEKAWAWLAQGGFIDEDATLGAAGFGIEQLKGLGTFLSDLKPTHGAAENNVFELDLEGATWKELATYSLGKVIKSTCYVRGKQILPVTGVLDLWVKLLERNSQLSNIIVDLKSVAVRYQGQESFNMRILQLVEDALEGMISDGWVKAHFDPSQPLVKLPCRTNFRTWLETVGNFA